MEDFFEGLDKALKMIGIKSGDILYISSDVRYLLYTLSYEIGNFDLSVQNKAFNMLTDKFQEAVGEDGTLLFPVFSWDFCRGRGFDYYYTQGEVGTYSNWVLNNRKDFRRTKHPMYSFMVWGKLVDLFCNMDNQEAWGEDSPFYYIMEHDGKQLEFNVESFKGLTFVHCIEQWVKVPYRHHKFFFGKYKGEDGKTGIRSYSMYVRDLDVSEHTKTTHEYLIGKNVAKKSEWKGNTLTLIDINRCYKLVQDDIIENDGKNNLQFADYDFKFSDKRTLPYEIGKIPDLEEFI